MTTLKRCYRFITLFIITCCCCCCGMVITSPPPASISKTDELSNHSLIEVIFNNKTALTHDSVKLVCEIIPRTTTVLGIVWMKGNAILSENRTVQFGDQAVMINQTMESDAGYYTCCVKTLFGSWNKTAYLTVIESEEEENDESEKREDDDDSSGEGEVTPKTEESPCGKPDERLYSTCQISYGFRNCKSLAPAVNTDDIKVTQIGVRSSKKPILKVKIQWKVPKAGNSDIWGWQVTLSDILLKPGYYECVQVNKKFLWEEPNGDYYVNYTFNSFDFGTKLKLFVQSLPGEKDSAVEKTFHTKDSRDCDLFPERPCCYMARNVSVKQHSDTSAIISWSGLTNSGINSTLISSFIVTYNPTSMKDPCHNGLIASSIEDALKKSHILVPELQPFCQNYSFKVTPVFSEYGCKKCERTCDRSSKKGRQSKLYSYRMTIVQASHLPPGERQPLLLKAVVVVVVLLTIVILFSVAMIVWKKKHVENAKEHDTVSTGRPAAMNDPEKAWTLINSTLVTEVFIAHASHCKDCDDVVLSVATYLNMTGHCKCYLDLCSLPKEWSTGTTQYYENHIAQCPRVIVLFTVDEKDKCEESIKSRNFIYQKNLIRSELLSNCPTTKFIPVYMDHLSDLDIPSFLRNKKSFSLPTQLTELVLYIIGEPVCKPVSVCPMIALEEDSNLMKHKKIMETKIKELNGKHQKKLKVKNNNTIAKIV